LGEACHGLQSAGSHRCSEHIQQNLSSGSMQLSKSHVLKTVLVFLLVAVSTIPLFKQQIATYVLMLGGMLTIGKLRINWGAWLFLLLALLLELFHNFYFDDYDLSSTRQVILVFAAAMLVIYYVKLDLLPIYVNILYYFSLISFPFFLLRYADSGLMTQLVNSVPGIFVKTLYTYGAKVEQVNPIIYNFDSNFTELGRNNGPFWEPTVFATMLIIAQLFNFLLTKKLFNKKGIIFTIAIFTTLSTTGILAYFVFVLSYFLLSPRLGRGAKSVIIGGLLIACGGLYTALPFLNDKIINEFDNADYEMDKYGGDSRIASAILDMREITEDKTYIFLGKGVDANYRVSGPDKDVLRNCGDTTLLVQWGAVYALIYIGLLGYSFFELTRFYDVHWGFSVVLTIIILILGFSEVYFNLPFFYALLFLGFIIKKKYAVKETVIDHISTDLNQAAII
jgi:hypothetical protein